MNDSLNLAFILIQQNYLVYIPNSIYFCKFFYSMPIILPAYSAWILVYISIERFIRINRDKKFFNPTILIGILLTCFFYFTPVLYYTEVIYITPNNPQYDCRNSN